MIHELLSNGSWLAPQIDYLIWIQNLRMSSGGIFDNCFLHITMFGELLIPTLIMCIIYWCFSFNAGLYLFSLNSVGLLAIHTLKMVACIYRPWVLSDKIKPLEGAMKMAGGYSFPSGHCAMASSTWGGMAYLLRNKKILCGAIIFLILLIAFSRNYVGVHTPQDVIVALLIGFVLVFATDYLLKWCEKEKNRYLYAMAVFTILSICFFVYIITKHYPMDYINGKLLVDPKGPIYVTVLYIGWVTGLFNGVMLCKRFFPFDAKQGSLRNKILRGTIGSVILLGLFFGLENYIFNNSWSHPVAFWVMFGIGFFITAIYPLIFTKIDGKLKH